jgi:hypothetical protein
VHDASLDIAGDRTVKKTLLMVVVLGSLASVADAGQNRRGHHHDRRPPTNRVTAPEIDPASAGSALTLLFGGLAVLRSRIGKKD